MHEIDPLKNNSDVRLSQALRSLAAASSSHAPAEVGETLARAFRQRYARRRARRRAAILVTIVVLSLPVWLLLKRPRVVAPTGTITQTAPASASPAPIAEVPSLQPLRAQATKRPVGHHQSATAGETTGSAADDFLPLRRLDPTVQMADMQVMRLELTGRALR